MREALWLDSADDHDREIGEYFHQNERKLAVFFSTLF
jgi:hypothetical protein